MRTFAEIIKDSPSVGDVHVTSALGNDQSRRRRRRAQMPISVARPVVPPVQKALRIDVPITKFNDELRTVYGWASVNAEDGTLVTDTQDDQVEDAELIKAAHDFVSSSRAGGVLHARSAAGTAHRMGDVVESLVLTPDIQKALGVDLGKTGWFIGYRVNDDDAWELVKSGKLKAFSIGGRARRIPV